MYSEDFTNEYLAVLREFIDSFDPCWGSPNLGDTMDDFFETYEAGREL